MPASVLRLNQDCIRVGGPSCCTVFDDLLWSQPCQAHLERLRRRTNWKNLGVRRPPRWQEGCMVYTYAFQTWENLMCCIDNMLQVYEYTEEVHGPVPVILRPIRVRFHADEPEDGVEQPKHSNGRKRLRRHNSDYYGPVISGPAPSSLPIRQLNGCAANKVSRPANGPPVIDLTVNRACAAAASLANTADNVVYIALPPRPNKKRKRGDAGPDEIDETSIIPRTPLWLERRPEE